MCLYEWPFFSLKSYLLSIVTFLVNLVQEFCLEWCETLCKSVVTKPDKIQTTFKRFPINEYKEMQNQAEPLYDVLFSSFYFSICFVHIISV